MLRLDRMGPGKAGDGQGHAGNRAKATALFGKRILETRHTMIHPWVGRVISQDDPRTARRGTMIVSTSPNDPVFFLHHANVDRLWAAWQARSTYEPKTKRSSRSRYLPLRRLGVS